MGIAQKLVDFDAKTAYRKRSLDDLNSLTDELNVLKKKLSKNVNFYLKNINELGFKPYKDPRLCHALAAPGVMASIAMKEEGFPRGDRFGHVKTKETAKIGKEIYNGLFLPVKNYYDNLSEKGKKLMNIDLNELMDYSHMYLEIDFVRKKGFVKNKKPEWYPDSNTFDYIFDMMNMGANTIRFQYVSRNGPKLKELVTTSHLLESEKGPEMVVHIEGYKKFSMIKMWGQGDSKLKPIYKQYRNMVIRRKKGTAQKALNKMIEQRNF